MRTPTLLLLGVSLTSSLALANPEAAVDGLERRLSHGHGPERALQAQNAQAPTLFPSPARLHKQFVQRGVGRVLSKLRQRELLSGASSTNWNNSTSGTVDAAAASTTEASTGNQFGSHVLPGILAGIIVAGAALSVLIYFLIRSLRSARPPTPFKSTTGFNPAPRPFHSKAASVSTISVSTVSYPDEKDSTSWAESTDREMTTLPSSRGVAPQLMYTPSSDITTAAGNPVFDMRSLPPTVFGSPSRRRSPSPNPGSPGRIPLPLSRSNSNQSNYARSRSHSQPPPVEPEPVEGSDSDYDSESSPRAHMRSNTDEGYYKSEIPFGESRPKKELAPDERE